MAKHIELGKLGEKMAAEYLLKRGYTILAKNWRFKKNEIDIVAKENNKLVIVEVKTRTTLEFGTPEEAVSLKKQQFLIRAANEYVNQKNLENEIRFDIIAVNPNSGGQKIHHIPDAFYPIV